METLETINTRRSIRKYENKKVSDSSIQNILKAAMNAPSAGNEQPWHFIVIDEKDILQKIPSISPYAGCAQDAVVAILVCGDVEQEKFEGFWVQDCSAAVENMLLAIHDLGLGAVWTGIYPMLDRVEGFREMFSLPKNIIPLALVPIGYPAQKSCPVDRFKKDRIHHNKW
jgi:nitroreductase